MSAPKAGLPLAPLYELAKRQAATPDGDCLFSDKEFSRMIRVSSRTVARWRADGDRLSWPAADDAATALSEYAGHIWGEAWTDLDRDLIEGLAGPKVEKEIAKAMDRIGEVLALEADTVSDHEFLIALSQLASR